ncbi:uncharacterized protein VICG_01520 [Vittaforma corneae ATCC 50505]|uniref:Diphthine--ammonia ligase n=1 Tax=Vittaforma corneae (strain ATCC 50505) TaxID=993615 RepID=L2GLN5_VITCO|nr:uncharacterized protein VICG_01520 [Vittaforma corneae ATCC 50505]ELA41415.1 hypothetical protein VICG_01520 [Vittaforma corneae ATCC 50505]
MDFVALVSGGKDSIYTACKLMDEGNKLVALVHIFTIEKYSDSYMYQTVGTEAAIRLGECLNVPIYCFKSKCKAVNTDLEYSECTEDEVEDLYNALKAVLEKHSFQAVSSGAIHSTYQKNRVENVCKRLNLTSLTPLWKRDQRELLKEMIDYGIDARIIKIASPSLSKKCLNANLREIKEYMDNQKVKYEMNYCGEGGEFESLVLDCRHFKMKMVVGSYEICSHPDEKNRDDGVYYLTLHNLSVIDK